MSVKVESNSIKSGNVSDLCSSLSRSLFEMQLSSFNLTFIFIAYASYSAGKMLLNMQLKYDTCQLVTHSAGNM